MTSPHKEEHPLCEIGVIIPEGFKDKSWCNDTMPHWENQELGLELWIDYKDEIMRDIPNGSRYYLYAHSFSGTIDRSFCETDDWDVLLRALNYLDLEQYKKVLEDCNSAERIVKTMNSFANRFNKLNVLKQSYDEVALDLANIRELFIFAGECWTKLMEKT